MQRCYVNNNQGCQTNRYAAVLSLWYLTLRTGERPGKQKSNEKWGKNIVSANIN